MVIDVGQTLRELTDVGEQLRQACAHACGLHPTDFKALGMIQRAKDEGNALTAGDLATRLDLSSGAVTYLVERLASAALVERDSDPQDRRKVLLKPTAKGYELAYTARKNNHEVIKQVLSELSQDDAETSLRAMRLLRDALQHRVEVVRTREPGQGA
ncbi:MarR family transcriptional regulator [Luteococcus peritonei]